MTFYNLEKQKDESYDEGRAVHNCLKFGDKKLSWLFIAHKLNIGIL